MDEDDIIDLNLETNDLLFEKPERIILTGTSYSGKTFLVEQLIKKYSHKFYRIVLCGNKNRLIEFKETREKTHLFSSDGDNIYNPFFDIDRYETIKFPNQQLLIVVDDLMQEVYKSEVVSQIFSKGRHLQISCVLILQAYCPSGSSTNIYPQIKK